MSAWIACSDRMPPPNTRVFIISVGKKKTRGPFIARHKNRVLHPWEWCDGNFVEMRVTHWMPIPGFPAWDSLPENNIVNGAES